VVAERARVAFVLGAAAAAAAAAAEERAGLARRRLVPVLLDVVLFFGGMMFVLEGGRCSGVGGDDEYGEPDTWDDALPSVRYV
jgi:hypothetical protein